MKNAIFYLLILLAVGVVGYLVFPKTDKMPAPLKNLATDGKASNESTVIPTNGSTSPAAANEVSSGLTLSVSAPQDKTTVSSQALQVIGKTSPNAEVFVNDVESKADSTGNFFVNYSLDEGENVLTVVANDSKGNYAEKELTVYLQSTQ